MRITKQDLRVRIFRYKDWYIIWDKNGKHHREDGPAMILSYDGEYYYYLKGKRYFKDKDKYWKEVHANY